MKNKLFNLSLPVIILIGFGIVILFGAICIPIATKMNIPTFIRSLSAETITPQQLRELQQNNPKSLLLIDVRSPEEYQEKHIEESILIPITDIEAGFGVKQIQDLIPKKEGKGTVVLYCTVGVRSFKAYEILKKQGINTSVLKGGIEAWQK